MSRENVDTWRASIEDIRSGIDAGQFDHEATISKMAALWAPDIEWDVSEAQTLDASGVYQGAEAARSWWREWFAAWEALRFEYELVGAGNRVVWLLDLRMQGRSTGIEVPLGEHAWVATFRDGLIVHQKLYMSQSQALQAAGLAG
jgi:ketosteroid isomerase-like protein